MLNNLFEKYLTLSGELRKEYPFSLGIPSELWREKFCFLNTPIPKLYETIYGRVSGTPRDIQEQKLMDFIPGYRLIYIDEIEESYNELIQLLDIKEGSELKIVPLLSNYSSDFICYVQTKSGQEYVADVMHDDLEINMMYDNAYKFLETICEFYRQGVYFLDDDGYLECDFIKESTVASELNPSSTYWI